MVEMDESELVDDNDPTRPMPKAELKALLEADRRPTLKGFRAAKRRDLRVEDES